MPSPAPSSTVPGATGCSFVPPWLVGRVAGAEQLAMDQELRSRRESREGSVLTAPAPGPGGWQVYDAESGTSLPGTPARATGESATGDVAVDEAADGITATLAMFAEDFDRSSYDDAGARVQLTV